MAAYSYSHSQVFAALKDITEQLPTNLTTSQYLQAYDKYISNATTPMIVGTRFFDSFLTSIVGWQEKNFRRKVTFSSRRLVPGKVINFLLQPTPEERVTAFEEIRLDRGVILEAIEIFIKRMEIYSAACDCRLIRKGESKVDLSYCMSVKKRIEDDLRVRVSLPTIISETQFWLSRAYAFKQVILEKYVRLCLNAARKDYIYYFNHSIPLDDIVPWYLLAASRAIDKCDSRQGALTSHIKNWFLTARSRVASQRDRNVSSINIELVDFDSEEFRSSMSQKPSVEDLEASEEHIKNIRYLARIADPIGVARAYLGIEEILPADADSITEGHAHEPE